MKEFGHIDFLDERYKLDDCKAKFSGDRVRFICEGPEVLFEFSKLRIYGATDVSAFEDFTLSSDRDDGDLGDYAKFTFYDEDYEFDAPWEVTCVTANGVTQVMAFQWNFIIQYGDGRIPKLKEMRGIARCSLEQTTN